MATAIGTLATSMPALLILFLHTLPLFVEWFERCFLPWGDLGNCEVETALRVSGDCVLSLLLGTVSGPILGLAQWWMLRDKVRRGVLWILVHTGAWLFMIGVSLSLNKVQGHDFGVVTGFLCLIPLAYAAQGLVLARLLRQRPMEQP